MLCLILTAGWLETATAATTNYVASIGVSQDGSSGSTGINDCKNELSGHVILERDLNEGAGGDYVYMGYKTTTDPNQAITGVLLRLGGNPLTPSPTTAIPSTLWAANMKPIPPNWAAGSTLTPELAATISIPM